MKTVSLKIDDSIFGETEILLTGLKKSRNRYINEAIDHYNKIKKRELIERQLRKESELVGKDSLNMVKEFDVMEHAD